MKLLLDENITPAAERGLLGITVTVTVNGGDVERLCLRFEPLPPPR
ncbi:MAG: hypothetical protein KIT31_32170 [Deltaproteobacteria bacterium]|nr:hypothetical protein [Deltaproteobacteria bacterium]